MRRIGLLVVLGLGLAAASAQADTTTAGGLRLVKVGDFVAPVLATGPTGDTERLFVVERGDGGGAASRIVLVRNGARLASPFLDLSQLVEAESSERGLLSMAFAPDYAASGLIYVYYTRRDDPATPAIDETGAIQVDEYRRSAVDPDRADPASRRPVLTELHPVDGNHNGGHLAFGPDGFLYASLGDGGGSNDVHLNAQSLATLLGKVIRIDPRERPGYAIPPDNPFVGRSGAREEIYAYGLRNPFRFSFDRLTGDLVIGDVGQNAWEEVDFTARGQGRGVNFGWSRYEAFKLNAGGFDPSLDAAGPYVPPVLDRSHGDGFCAVTGGYVVRDPSVAALAGRYLFGDYCKGDLETAVLAPGSATAQTTTGLRVDQVAGFGEDGRCRIHVDLLRGPRLPARDGAPPPAVAAARPVPGASVPLPPTTAIVDRTRPSIVDAAVLPDALRGRPGPDGDGRRRRARDGPALPAHRGRRCDDPRRAAARGTAGQGLVRGAVAAAPGTALHADPHGGRPHAPTGRGATRPWRSAAASGPGRSLRQLSRDDPGQGRGGQRVAAASRRVRRSWPG